jgi:CO/xanthine dehydrogenase Mo-binding subunit
MRWDETGWDFTGNPVLLDVEGGIDANGKITVLKYASMANGGFSGTGVTGTEPSTDASGTSTTVQSSGAVAADVTAFGLYTVGTTTARTMTGYQFLRGSYLRAPATPQATFGEEQFIDMLAHAAKMDPIAFRKLNMTTANLTTYGLSLDALQKAAGWKPRAAASELDSGNIVRGRGVAINGFGGSEPAGVAEVEVNRKTGKISVLHYYAVQNNGLSGLTSLVENQMSGCVVQGTSRALHETTSFSPSRVLAVDWVTYPILRFKDTPTVTTITLPLISAPGGSGEPSTVPVPAAIANAFFDATGVRAFQYPMTTAYTRGVLQAAAKGITPLPVGIKAGMALFTD